MSRRLRTSMAAATALLSVLALASATVPPAAASATVPPAQEKGLAPHVAGRVLVGFAPGTSAADRAAARRAAGASAAEPLSRLAPDAEVVTLANGRTVTGAMEALRRNPNVRYAEPDYLRQAAATSNDPQYTNGTLWGMYGDTTAPANQWGTQAGEAWASGHIGSDSVYVVVIDEGIDVSHPDLAGNIWSNPHDPVDGVDNDGNGYADDTWGWDFVSNNRTVYDAGEDSHGTHVSGTIGGSGGNGIGVAGVNWDVTLISAKFLGPSGGTTANAVRAVDYATDLKTRHGLNIVTTSNSWGGGGFSQSLLDAINRGGDAGITFVAAAGNSSTNNDSGAYYPSGYQCTNGGTRGWDCVVAVASITSTGALSSFSSYGATTVDIGAPGSSIMSTLPGNTYGSYNGTSMATPHVSGAIALCAAINPALTARERRAAVMNSAAPTPSLDARVATNGRLDVGAMVAQCRPATVPVTGAPTGLTAVASSTTSVTLAWTDGSTNETFHEIQRAGGDCTSFTTVATAGSDAVGAVVVGLTAATPYCFRVRAGNSYNGGSTTTWSNTTTSRTLDPPPPYACSATAYSWIDATAGGTQRTLTDDSSVAVPIGFGFTWYGTSYSNVYVGSNGLVGFGDTVTGYSNVAIPSAATPNSFAAPLWDDLNPGAGGQVWTRTLGSGPNRQFVASWIGVPHFSVTGSAATFQVVLNEADRSVVFQYLDTVFGSATYDRGASATVGVEDPAGTYGAQVSFNSASRSDLTAVACAEQATTPSVATSSLAVGTVDSAYQAGLSATGGTAPYTWALRSGSLPVGLALDAAGTISGTPTVAGSTAFTVRATDATGAVADRQLTVQVVAPVTVTTTTLPAADETIAYSAALAAAGGQPGYTWTLASGSTLPAGLSLSSAGTISGTPTTAGSSSFDVVAEDSAGRTGSATLAMTVDPFTVTDVKITVMDVRLNTNKQGTAATVAVGIAGLDDEPISGLTLRGVWSVDGGSTSTASGSTAVDGTVTIASPRARVANGVRFQFCVNDLTDPAYRFIEQDSAGRCANRLLAAAPAVSSSSLPAGNAGAAYSTQLAATGGDSAGGYTWQLAAGSLPTGLNLSSGGLISGTPTGSGTASFTVRVSDSGAPALTAERQLALTVNAALPVLRVSGVTVTTSTNTKGTAGTATVTVVDGNGTGVGSVAVSGRWTVSGVASTTSGTTGTSGVATFTSPRVRGGTGYQFCVTGLSRTGYTFSGTEVCATP